MVPTYSPVLYLDQVADTAGKGLRRAPRGAPGCGQCLLRRG